jgi:hypothetical protein
MSLGLGVKVIFSLQARNMDIAWDSTQYHVSEHIFGVGTHVQLRTKPHTIREFTYRATVELDPWIQLV